MNRDKLNKRKRTCTTINAEMLAGIKDAKERHEANEFLRKSQQGKGKPIISAEFNGHRLVAVGNKLHFQPLEKTKTFLDFLNSYILNKFTENWWKREAATTQPHPLIRWHSEIIEHQHKYIREGIVHMPLLGVVSCFYNLAYNLYLLEHNIELQSHFLNRLKNVEHFFPACYETYVAAWFVIAGFSIELEDEDDTSTTHVEFVATASNGDKYSVEAKQRTANKNGFAIGNQLAKALKKEATGKRIIFIDLNVPQERILDDLEGFLSAMDERILNLEKKLVVNKKTAPGAYLFITNHPYHLHLGETKINHFLMIDGFKIPDFKTRKPLPVIDLFKSKQKHKNVWDVVDAIKDYEIPSTFDGKLPEEAIGNMKRRFVLGQSYELRDCRVGKITEAIVNESQKEAVLTVRSEDNSCFIAAEALTDEEMQAYKRHPETFFGKIRQISQKADEPLELFEFLYWGMKGITRERMLDWFKIASDLRGLEELDDEELLLKYVERHVIFMINRKSHHGR